MAAPRSKKCEGCNGIVRVPKGTRRFSLEQILANHRAVCPATTRRKK